MADIHTALVSRLIFPAQERIKGHSTVRVRRSLEETQWLSTAGMRELQLRRLRPFLADVEANVPYYRDLFRQHGFQAAKLESTAELCRLPLLTKHVIRAHADALKARNARGLARFNTGGSSGEPLIFYIGTERVSHDVAAKWRATRWWDVDIGDREIVVWGSPIELNAQDRLRLFRDWLLRSELLPAFAMSGNQLDAFVERIRKRHPTMLFGYPSSLSLIAKHAEACHVALNNLGIKVAFVTSERLYEEQRATMGRVFGCRVANGYGGRDAGFVAHECPRGGMHITAEDIIVEIVDPAGAPMPNGQSGEIVVTHLATRDFPFIRYRTGDIGTLDDAPCPCGRGLPLLKEIQGRTTDFVVATNGTVMHGLALVYPIRDLPGISAFKIVQETLQRTCVEIVPGAGYNPTIEASIVSGIRARLGPSVVVKVNLVPEIPPESSGKFRFVKSMVSP